MSFRFVRLVYLMLRRFACLSLFVALPAFADEPVWVKHTVAEFPDGCQTALAGDFTGDGQVDIIASASRKVSLYTAPDWQETVLTRFVAARSGRAIHSAVTDVDEDGDLDWIGGAPFGIPFWLENPGDGSGAWARRPIDGLIGGIHCFLLADLDGDGREELVLNHFEPKGSQPGLGNSILGYHIPKSVQKADPWPRFFIARGDARGGSHYFSAADLDGDGDPDLAAGAKGDPFIGGNWFAWWANPGGKAKGWATKADSGWRKSVISLDETGASNIEPADVDLDGDIDLIGSRGHGLGIVLFRAERNGGAVSWTKQEIDPDLDHPHNLTVADLDGDGDMDAAACGRLCRRVRWYENDGTGSFSIREIGGDQESYDTRAIDMDGDGDLDLVMAGSNAKNVVWYENRLSGR